MNVLIALCNHSFIVSKLVKHRPRPSIKPSKFYSCKVQGLSYTDAFVENLALEEGIRRESKLSKYLENIPPENLLRETLQKISFANNQNLCNMVQHSNINDLVCFIEEEINTKVVPNDNLNCLLICFSKDGNVNGVKAIQFIVEKYNMSHFKSQAEYKHYLAEAFWVSGKMHTSIQLFSLAYDNLIIRPKVRVMLPNLFPTLIAQHSEAKLNKVINAIEVFSVEKQDSWILASLWRELFLSSWFSDQEQASNLFMKNNCILKNIRWMVPLMGKNLLRLHRVEDFYRLIQFTLENELKSVADTLIRLLFEYYYIHQNIERCTAVVKYSSNVHSPLTEEQQKRYVTLLLKSKDAACSKAIVKKPQNLSYRF